MYQRKWDNHNFNVGDHWISLNREVFVIIEVLSAQMTHYPLLLERLSNGSQVLASRSGIFSNLSPLAGDRLVIKLSYDHSLVTAIRKC